MGIVFGIWGTGGLTMLMGLGKGLWDQGNSHQGLTVVMGFGISGIIWVNCGIWA